MALMILFLGYKTITDCIQIFIELFIKDIYRWGYRKEHWPVECCEYSFVKTSVSKFVCYNLPNNPSFTLTHLLEL